MSGDDEDTDRADLATEDAASPARAAKPRGARQQEREAADFWGAVLGSLVGRREMWRILAEAHTFETMFACGPNGFPQESATWFRAGEQALGQRLYQTWLRREPELVALMLRENHPAFQSKRRSVDAS